MSMKATFFHGGLKQIEERGRGHASYFVRYGRPRARGRTFSGWKVGTLLDFAARQCQFQVSFTDKVLSAFCEPSRVNRERRRRFLEIMRPGLSFAAAGGSKRD